MTKRFRGWRNVGRDATFIMAFDVILVMLFFVEGWWVFGTVVIRINIYLIALIVMLVINLVICMLLGPQTRYFEEVKE